MRGKTANFVNTAVREKKTDEELGQENLNAVIRQHSEWLASQLHAQRENLFPPDAHKAMRVDRLEAVSLHVPLVAQWRAPRHLLA